MFISLKIVQIFIWTWLLIQVAFCVVFKYKDGDVLYEYDDQRNILDSGQYGTVFHGTRTENNITEMVAFKEMSTWHDWKNEIYIYEKLGSHISIPKYYRYLLKNENKVVFAMELLGKNLFSDLMSFTRFSTPTVMRIGLQVLDTLEYIHSKKVVHLDFHTGNFAVGYTNKSRIYVFDFGMSIHPEAKAVKRGKDFKTLANDLEQFAYGFDKRQKLEADCHEILREFREKASVHEPNIEDLRIILRTELEKHTHELTYDKFEWELTPNYDEV